MVLVMSLIRMYYILIVICSGVLAYLNVAYYLISVLLIALLYLTIRAIPLQLAWDRSNFKNLIWMHTTTIIYSIFIYGYIYHNNEMMKDGMLQRLDLFDSVYLSLVTWTTLGYSNIIPNEKLYLSISLETFNGYFSMALLVALIVVWITEAMNSLDERVSWLRSCTPGDIEEMQRNIFNKTNQNKKEESTQQKGEPDC